MIPKIIMQTWKTKIVPDHWKSSQESIQKYMPKWKYVLMSDEDNRNFVSKHFPEYLDFFDDLKYNIQRADVIRYMFLYIHGGLYLDLDIEVVAPLDELFENRSMETWLLQAPRNLASQYTNFFMASTAKNPFWLDVLKECTQPLPLWARYIPHFVISYQTGLGALTRAVKKSQKPIALLPFNYLVPCDYCNPDECTKPYSYTKFLRGQSWNNYDTLIFNFIFCNPVAISLCILFICLVLFFRRSFIRYRRKLVVSSK